MSFMPKSLVASLSAGERPALRSSTKYMETFQLSVPALGGTDIRTFPNAKGNLDLYTIGTNDAVFRLRRGEDSDAPYEQTDLRITGRQLFPYTTASESSDTPNIISLGANGQLRLATYRAATGSYFQEQTKPATATESIRQFRGVRGITGNIYVNVILDQPGVNYGLLANNFFRPGTSTWAGAAWAPIMGPDGTQARVLTIAMVENSPVQSAIFAIGENFDVLFSESSDRTSKLRILGPRKATALSVVVDQNDRLNIFAVEKDSGKLLLKKEKKYQSGSIKQFDDWIVVDPTQTVALTSIYASQCFNDLLQVFGIGTDGRLWRTAQIPPIKSGSDPSWGVTFPLGNSIPAGASAGASIFTVGRDLSGYAQAYTVSAAGDLSRFWQSPSSGQWFQEDVTLLRTDNQMVPVQTHALELTVLDEDGMPVPFAKVSVLASFMVTLFVDGRSYRCSQLNRVNVEAGPNGLVVIHQKANALAAATLYIETSETLAGSPIQVEPNLQLQEKLADLRVDQIKNAKDAKGNYLLEEKYRSNDEYSKSLQQITQAAMQIAGQQDLGVGRKINYQTVSRAKSAKGFSPTLNLSAIEGTAWAIDFSTGFPQYQAMSASDVADWRASKLSSLKATHGDSQAAGFLGIDWGNVWNGIKEGFEYIVDGIKRIVVEVINGIGRVLFEIGNYVFEAIIEFAQQAFDFVQGVWNWLKVKLEKLFEWLAFLFNVDDIVRTAEAVEHNIAVLLDFTADGVDQIKNIILSGIDTMKDTLKSTVDNFVAELNKDDDPTYKQFSETQPLDDEQAYEMEHNVFANAYQQNGGKASENGQNAMTLMSSAPLSSSLDSLVTLLEDLANNFQFGDGKAAFDEAIGYFTAIGDNPNNALNLLMSGIVKVMESTALFALDAARAVIATILDLIREVIESFKSALFAGWEIPIISPLYKFFTGKTLSIRLSQLCAYLIAIPTTLIYKFATDTAPFPDQAALDAYKNYVTVDWFKSKFGMPTTALVRFDSTLEKVVACVSLAIYSGAMFVRIFSDVLTGFFSATAVIPAGGQTKIPDRLNNYQQSWSADGKRNCALVSVLLRYITTGATAPWLIRSNVGAPSCPAGQPGFSGVIWLCQVVFGPTRGLFVTLAVPGGRPRVYTGEVTLALWGVANMFMVAWNYSDTPDKNTLAKLGLARALTNIIPGQVTRAAFLPDIQGPYFIPAIIGEVLIVVGYFGSIGVAVSELVEIAAS